MPSARYRPYVDALQWTGANITEVRQFIRMTANLTNLYGPPTNNGGVISIPFLGNPNGAAITVNVNDWMCRNGNILEVWDTTEFGLRYLAEP